MVGRLDYAAPVPRGNETTRHRGLTFIDLAQKDAGPTDVADRVIWRRDALWRYSDARDDYLKARGWAGTPYIPDTMENMVTALQVHESSEWPNAGDGRNQLSHNAKSLQKEQRW